MQGRILKRAKCARAHEAAPHWRPTIRQAWKLSCWSLSSRCG